MVAFVIPIIRPLIGEEEIAAVAEVLRSGWVTQGPRVAQFERDFAAAVGASHACAVSSCTTGLELALRVVGVGPGDEVATVSHSFIATANAIRYCGASPIFVDIDRESFNLDPDLLERAITPRTRAILVVHQIGMPADLARVLEVAKARAIPVIEDAACAIGAEIEIAGQWERIGKPHGDLACFSFHPRKLVTAGEGGMLTTANEGYDQQLRLLRHQGMSVSDAERHGSKKVIFEQYPIVGYNYRMTDIQAAVGRVQLSRLDEIIARRRQLAARYGQLLSDLSRLTPPIEPAWARSNFQSYCVRLPTGTDQRAVLQAMLDDGVGAKRGIMCAHREPAYPRSTWSCGPRCSCPADGPCTCLTESEQAQDGCVVLPLYHQMTEDEQDQVVASLRRAMDL